MLGGVHTDCLVHADISEYLLDDVPLAGQLEPIDSYAMPMHGASCRATKCAPEQDPRRYAGECNDDDARDLVSDGSTRS
jgi:hypothetical protein